MMRKQYHLLSRLTTPSRTSLIFSFLFFLQPGTHLQKRSHWILLSRKLSLHATAWTCKMQYLSLLFSQSKASSKHLMASTSSNLNNHPFFGWQPPLSVYNDHAEFYHPILKAAGTRNEQVHCVFDSQPPWWPRSSNDCICNQSHSSFYSWSTNQHWHPRHTNC